MMFKSTFAALALIATATAQYTIDPDSVSISTRKRWCADQTTQCPMICQQTTSGSPQVNTCDASSLSYGCLCSDGTQPNITEYSLTLPYYICTEWGNQCVAACGNHNNDCASACRENHPCGALNPTRVNVTSTTSSAATASATGGDSEPTLLSDSGSSKSSSSSGASRRVQVGGFIAAVGSLAVGLAML